MTVADFGSASAYPDMPVWLGVDDYGPGLVSFEVRKDDLDVDSISTSLQRQGWREPTRGDTRPYGLLALGNDDADLVLEASVGERPAVFDVFRQTPAMTWPIGIVFGGLTAAATVVPAQRWPERPVSQRGSLPAPVLIIGLWLLAPATPSGLMIITATPVFLDIGATEPVPGWGAYGWWVLKPVSNLGAGPCASSAVAHAWSGRSRANEDRPCPV